MALQKSITLPSGISASNAYHKIERVHLSLEELLIDVVVFADVNARNTPLAAIARQSYQVAAPESVSIASAYTVLKTFEDYSDAVDV
jgi:hypothetical protein